MNPLHASVAALIACLGGCVPACKPVPAKPTAEVLIFCGVNPYVSNAPALAQGLSDGSKATATYGPCLKPDASYTAAEPGVRELDRNGYAALVELNAAAGMKTVVYDAGIWSQDAVVRQSTIDFWSQPSRSGGRMLDHVYGWNLGDEYDPDVPASWDVLKQRWNTVLTYVTPVTGLLPMANHLGNARTLNQALADLPRADENLSFDQYLGDFGVGLAKEFGPRTSHLQCAVNAFSTWAHDPAVDPTPAKIEMQMSALRSAGCDGFLIFGGTEPEGTAEYGTVSLVTSSGAATPWAGAVAKGARS